MIDEHGAAFHAAKGAGLAQRDGAQVVVIADAGEHEIGALGRRAWGRRGLAAKFVREASGFRRIAVIDRHRVARPREMTGDG